MRERTQLHECADYVTKPFSPGVLIAKIKSHLRRVSTGRSEQLLELPGLTLDFYAQSVIMGSEAIFLSKKGFSLLSYMAQHINRVISVDTLFQLIWGTESLEETRTVAVHISNIRKKSSLTLLILRESLPLGGRDICWLPEVRRLPLLCR
ncbi:response regulator transcription factor [Paenibacillus amylolyticus]|uniref:response regulator transcription factor n=1 Tax=Paenibacillus amylolyticus TaxID=1451 RepID=UPI003EB6C657